MTFSNAPQAKVMQLFYDPNQVFSPAKSAELLPSFRGASGNFSLTKDVQKAI